MMVYQKDLRSLQSLNEDQLDEVIQRTIDLDDVMDWSLVGNQVYIINLLKELLRRRKECLGVQPTTDIE